MKIKALIIEDNPQAALVLEELCAAHPDVDIVGTVGSLEEGRELFYCQRPNLLFLDIELPDGSGIDFWNEVRSQVSWHTHVVFYTAFDHYVIDALRSQAHDFLLKPVLADDFNDMLSRYYRKCTELLLTDAPRISGDAENGKAPLMVVDNKNNRIVIQPESIALFHYISDRKLWETVCVDGESYIMRHGLNADRILDLSGNFVQVHKSYIVNIKFMARFEDNHIVFRPPFENIKDVTVSKLHRHALFEHFCML